MVWVFARPFILGTSYYCVRCYAGLRLRALKENLASHMTSCGGFGAREAFFAGRAVARRVAGFGTRNNVFLMFGDICDVEVGNTCAWIEYCIGHRRRSSSQGKARAG